VLQLTAVATQNIKSV